MSLVIKKILQKIKEFDEKTQDSGWQNLQFINGWHNGSGQNPAQYRKIGNQVFLRGLVYNGGNNNRNTAQLPNGFFNSNQINNVYFTVWFNGTDAKDLQITNRGAIISTTGMIDGQWYSLDGISFPVD